jgi:nitrate/TMAO reductase-like tetraheme cytochrome c subunit
MPDRNSIREKWLRPFFFYGNNWLSLLGGAITTASALVLIGFWVVAFLGHGASSNPYLGIIFDLILPGIFVAGLLLILIGILVRRSYLVATDQVPSFFPEVSINDPVFKRGIDFVVVATCFNFIIVGTASYRGVAYMDTSRFCGASCHVMAPEFAAYHVASHSNVACTDCHVAPTAAGYVHAKLNGTKQLLMVLAHDYPRPIMAGNKVPVASMTCVNCHSPAKFVGDKVVVTTAYGDDELNSQTSSVTLMHVGGRDSFAHLSGIHGAHMGKIEYIATDSTNQTIPWVQKTNDNGSVTEFAASGMKGPVVGQRRLMDCIDCHNRAAHSFDTPENALNKDMAQGSPSPSLPFVHREGLALMKAEYESQADAQARITADFITFYRSQYPAVWNSQRPQIYAAAKVLVDLYTTNVFPSMKVTWGTHPNNIGHNDSPGCFRCHDGDHTAKGGASITNDCAVCHNLVVSDAVKPKLLVDMGLQQ